MKDESELIWESYVRANNTTIAGLPPTSHKFKELSKLTRSPRSYNNPLEESYVTNNQLHKNADLEFTRSPSTIPQPVTDNIKEAIIRVVDLMNDNDKQELCKVMNIRTVEAISQQFFKMGEQACIYWLENAHSFYEEDKSSNWGSLAFRHHR